ncbi:hypothetical protein NX862_19025 [Rhodobacter sp. KR11]|uniref:hypothetical protein n=1 Tax=Rhodobacter sp. KR11 TaxID=2974588 RepID=UPI002221F691|nr:hypothetical protein [Rhodobacter sp. KR11]MCW1920857.1 hypothetical protein [Rhodobacter sp. KR11]
MAIENDVPLSIPTPVSVELLDFDRDNPRFTPDKEPENTSDQAIIIQLNRTADLGELIQSLGFNGYIGIEPMIVYAADDRLVVLEGNRRLAAIKCLRDKALAKECGVSTPHGLPDAVLASFRNILVFRVADKDGAKNLIGFKHINGPQAWDAYAKALFALRWLDTERAKPGGLSLSDIALRMGDKHDTLLRMVTAAYVIRQAEGAGVYDLDERTKKSFSFSHLYTALAYAEFTTYLGMDRPARNADPIVNPVPQAKLEELRRLLKWLYGSKRDEVEPVIQTQAKDLNRLKSVIAHPAALRELTERGNLEDAVVTATPRSSLFAANIVASAATLKTSLETAADYDPEAQPELLEFAVSCSDRADAIVAVMQRKNLKAEKK